MFRIVFMVFSISYAANTSFNPLECCCGCRTSSCPLQGVGCPSPRNPCVNAFFILRRQIAPCAIFERQRLGSDSFSSIHQKQADNGCRSPLCFIAPQDIPKNVIYNNVLPYGKPKTAKAFARLAFQSVDANAGDSVSERVILSPHPSNVPTYDQNDEYGSDRIRVAPSVEASPIVADNQRSADNQGEDANRRMAHLHESPSHQDLPAKNFPTNTASAANKSIVSPHVNPDFSSSTLTVDNMNEGGTQGIVLVPASSIFEEASEPETFTESSINEQTDPTVNSEVDVNYDEHPEMLPVSVPEHFSSNINTSGTGKQPTIDSAFLYSLLEQDGSSKNNEHLSVYDAISSDFHESQKGKAIGTTNKSLIVTLSVVDRLHSTNQTENKSSIMDDGRDDVIPQTNSSDRSGKMLNEGQTTVDDRQIRADETVNKTSRNERPFAQGTITVMKENNIDQLSQGIGKANDKKMQEAIVKIEQIDPTLARIDSVLSEIQEVLLLVKEELEMDEADAYKQLGQSRCAANDKTYSLCKHDSDGITEQQHNIIAEQAESNQQPKKHGIAYKSIKNMKGRSGDDSEEMTDVIQEIIKNLRLMQLRNMKRKNHFKQTQTSHKKLDPSSHQNIRSKRAPAKEFFESAAPAQGSDSIAVEHDLYDDDLIITDRKSTVAKTKTTTLPPNSAISASTLKTSGITKLQFVIPTATTVKPIIWTTASRTKVPNEPDIAWSSDNEDVMNMTVTKEERLSHSESADKIEQMNEDKPGWTNNCNDEELKRIIERNIVVNDASISKRKIQRVAEKHFTGTFDVICSRAEFSYIISSDTYCEGGKGEIACLAFRQEYP